ncbi:MAG: hypothetical protein ACRC4M_03985 [Mycoplasma sp.]
MKKIEINSKKNLIGGVKFTNSMGFAAGLGLNLLSNMISNVTGTVSQAVYNDNPNPVNNRSNTYRWSGNNFRFSPDSSRSAYSVIGGW